MIFGGKRFDQDYRLWFAWRPVILNGPDEWTRCRRLHCRRRAVWLRFVWRMRNEHCVYYALPNADTNNDLLLTSVENASMS